MGQNALAASNIKRMREYLDELDPIISNYPNELDEWIEAKIQASKDHLITILNYLQQETEVKNRNEIAEKNETESDSSSATNDLKNREMDFNLGGVEYDLVASKPKPAGKITRFEDFKRKKGN